MEQASEKFDKSAAPNLAIDGARIRGVREAKKLTQLYVASVVGVTTDTISRWENNRYPSIKRDNAEKLALALEVELQEILRQGEAEEPQESSTLPPAKPRSLSLLFSGLVAVAIILAASFYFFSRPTPAPSAVRYAPHFGAPGEIVPVQIKVSREQDKNIGFILKERLPVGFRLLSSLPANSAVARPSGSEIKWLIPGGNAAVTVSYTVQLPASVTPATAGRLSGEVVLHAEGVNRTETVSGNDQIVIGAYHWADTNGDGRIDDDEIMPAYYICEEMKGLGLDWKTIEAIWSGKGYRWDPKSGFTVLK